MLQHVPSSSLISQPPGLPAAAHLTTGSYSQTAGDDEACCKPNSAPYHADKFQMNRLFVAHVQCTLNLVIVISGGHGTLKVCSSQLPSVFCTYLETCGVDMYGFQMSTDS